MKIPVVLFVAAAVLFVAAVLALPGGAASAASSAEHQARRPDLFHPRTGLRISRFRAPTPDDVPGGVRIGATRVRALKRAVRLDVGPAASSRYDDLEGTWLVGKRHLSLPGAVWLPEVGRGVLTPVLKRYLASNLARLTGGDRRRPIIVFCIADCWMSWNAAQRIRAIGYARVLWFAEGTDGWLDQGFKLVPVDPVPVRLD